MKRMVLMLIITVFVILIASEAYAYRSSRSGDSTAGVLVMLLLATGITAIALGSQKGALKVKVKQQVDQIHNLYKNIHDANESRSEMKKQLEKTASLMIQLKDILADRYIGMPVALSILDEVVQSEDMLSEKILRYKKHAAMKAADTVKLETSRRRVAERELKSILSKLEMISTIIPRIGEVVHDEFVTEEDIQFIRDTEADDDASDAAAKFLSREEYLKLSVTDRNQLALDRYWTRKNKSNLEIGCMYERYVGYLMEMRGYKVSYTGIKEGLSDLGRDLVCENDNEIVIVQCKHWAKFRTIYEKYIFQLFGTTVEYRIDKNPNKKVKAAFFTTTKLSETAYRVSKEIGVEIYEVAMDYNYPCIKCNVNPSTKERIYHLPFDQMYDRTLVKANSDEHYCKTVKEAEDLGFRRAKKWYGQGK